MPSVREIVTEWGLPSGTPSRTVMYFDAAGAVAAQRDALDAFWTAVQPYLASVVGRGIQTTGRELDDATGTLTGVWTDTRLKQGVGTGSAQTVPDASQALVRWRCGTIINGRFLRGRTFIPGISSANVSNGNLAPGAVTAITAAANTLASAATPLKVWHRPIASSGGSQQVIVSSIASTEFAVLRRRRN